MSRRALLIISDSPMWKVGGKVFVFEPTLREVEWLADCFETITWIGYNFGEEPKLFARPTVKRNIEFIPLDPITGGSSFSNKLAIVPKLPVLWITLIRAIRQHHNIHTRGPSVPALIAILFSLFDSGRTYWHKYAGNWIQQKAPRAYALQRFLLRRCRHAVSVNGQWPGEPSHIISLENPCFTEAELKVAWQTTRKIKTDGIVLCFVGALTPAKGIWEFLRAIPRLLHAERIEKIYIAGDGVLRAHLEEFAATLNVAIIFLGNIKRERINQLYQESDVIVLPSANEGFPKVIAEASAFGCLPVVSNVSSINQYINDGINGVLLPDTGEDSIASAIDLLLNDPDQRNAMVKELTTLASLFTYEGYCARVCSEIFKI